MVTTTSRFISTTYHNTNSSADVETQYCVQYLVTLFYDYLKPLTSCYIPRYDQGVMGPCLIGPSVVSNDPFPKQLISLNFELCTACKARLFLKLKA